MDSVCDGSKNHQGGHQLFHFPDPLKSVNGYQNQIDTQTGIWIYNAVTQA